MMDLILELLTSTFRVATPLLFAALGGMFSERSGVVNIALEGKMLIGSLVAASAALAMSSAWAGLGAAALAGVCVGAIYGLFVITFRADQIVAGTAINMLALGLTPFLANLFFGSSGSTPNVNIDSRFVNGPIWFAWIAVALCWAWTKFSASGLWVTFAGEHPAALDTAGLSVLKTRWMSVLMAGLLAGLGGASLSICLASSFTRNMTSGRGFMALAALILGKWRPVPTAFACLLFAFADAVQIRLQGVTLWNDKTVPVQFIQILPYLLTVLILAGFVGQSRAPRALGSAFQKS